MHPILEQRDSFKKKFTKTDEKKGVLLLAESNVLVAQPAVPEKEKQ